MNAHYACNSPAHAISRRNFLAGTAVGAAGGYWVALQQQSNDQGVLATQVRGDLTRENEQIGRTQLISVRSIVRRPRSPARRHHCGRPRCVRRRS